MTPKWTGSSSRPSGRGFGEMGAAAAAAWGEETEEQRTLRRERYRRYATQQRKDVPYDDLPGALPVILCAALAIGYFSVAYPKSREEEERHDSVTPRDLRGDRLVDAFFNPLSGQWERLPKGFLPPIPHRLHQLYKLSHPSLRLDKSHMPIQFNVAKVKQAAAATAAAAAATAAAMPLSQTEPSRLVLDPLTGEHLWTADLAKRQSSSSSNNSGNNGSSSSNSENNKSQLLDAASRAAPQPSLPLHSSRCCCCCCC
ncbi:hypothetical protein Emag_001556 [Eimeria magna]